MNKGEIIIYSTPDGQTALDVHLEEDMVWLTQAQMVELFGSSKANISEHITSVYKSQELESKSTVRKSRTVQKEGSRNVSRNIEFYNLDMIIAIRYRVNSKRGYAINQKAKLEQLDDLKKTIKRLSSVVENQETVGRCKAVEQTL